MTPFEDFLQVAFDRGFSVAVRWTRLEDETIMTYSMIAPNGEPFGRGVRGANNFMDEDLLKILTDSAKKTMDYIERERPDCMTKKEPAEIFAR